MKEINVALVGVGDVASALVQGVEYYKKYPEKIIGMLPEITQYTVGDINFVLGIDVNADKIGKDLSKAIFIEPNCNLKLYEPGFLNAQVIKGPILDGLDSNIKNIVPVDNDQPVSDVKQHFKEKNVDVVVILLPTGCHNAVDFYVHAALDSGACVVNGMPSYVAKNPTIIQKAKEDAKQDAETIIRNGEIDSENSKKIMISKATQDIRRDMMNAKEEMIERCFSEALEKLKNLPDASYRAFIKTLIQTGKKRLGNQCSVSVSRAIDSEIAKEENVSVRGTIHSIGGVILYAPDDKITIDNTFEGLLNRKKDDIRIQVGKLLFPS